MGTRILILGGGPCGLAAAYLLSRNGLASVLLLEQGDGFGGHARTIAWKGHRLDYGSHRLEPTGDPRVLADLEALLEGDLLERPRRARIHLLGRWMPYPVPNRSFFSRLRLKAHSSRLPREVCQETLFSGPRRFLYPRLGFGQISESLAAAARGHGADLRLRHRVTALTEKGEEWSATVTHRGESVTLAADQVWSTIPLPHLVRLLSPEPPEEVLHAAARQTCRGMLLVYLEIDVDRFSEFDAHHLPSDRFRVTRVSEPKCFAGRGDPAGRTVLCAEIPCNADDDLWNRSNIELASLVTEELIRADLAVPRLPRAAHVERLPMALPAMNGGGDGIRDHLATREGLVVLGRQDVLREGHTLDALAAAYAAVDLFSDPRRSG